MKLSKLEMSLDPKDLKDGERRCLLLVGVADTVWVGQGWRFGLKGELKSDPAQLFIPILMRKKLISEIGSGSFRALQLTTDGQILFDRIKKTEQHLLEKVANGTPKH